VEECQLYAEFFEVGNTKALLVVNYPSRALVKLFEDTWRMPIGKFKILRIRRQEKSTTMWWLRTWGAY
jgi:hypothetical protein